jgi:D-alanyl-D-alanine carboxypeptidase
MRTLMIVLLLACAAASTPDERITAAVAALNGTAEDYEAFAQEAFSKEMLAAGPERRKQFYARLRGDFGKLTAGAIQRTSPTSVRVPVEGATGLRGALIFEHGSEPPYRLTSFSVGVGGPAGNQGPKLPPPPIRGSMSGSELAAALDPYLLRLTKDELFSGVVLIARDGKPVFERAYGLASHTYDFPNRTTTRFDLASINKQFTKVAIGQLREQNRLSLEDPLGKHLPDYPNAGARKATIGQLLEHRGGLTDFFDQMPELSLGRFRSNHDWYEYVAPLPLAFEPGTKRQYCNSCYVVLGEIIERLSGMPYEQYIQRNVFDPAGMKHTGFFHRDAPIADVATGYTKEAGEGLRSNTFQHGAAGSAAGGAYATAADLLAFERRFREGGEAVGYAGGAPGVNASVESSGTWVVIVLANMDPPAATGLTSVLHKALQ